MAPSLLEQYVGCERQPERDILYLRLYAEKVRQGTDLQWEIPSVRASILEGIADRIEAA